MIRVEPSFTFGIEEEFFLVDRDSRTLAAELPPQLPAALEAVLGRQFSPEYMRSQIEIATPVCTTSLEARRALARLRRSIVNLTGQHGLAPIAAATHPFSRWSQQQHTDTPRYNGIADDLQGLGRRMLVNGLHVHIGIGRNELRIELMNELRQFLPLLLALSTSSPFWGGEATGLKSYRTAVNDATPRKGIPERFAGWRDFERAVRVLVRAGVIEDATKLWWDVRPSVRFPTLELRITDVCPLIDDTICIAALVRCLCRYLYRMSRSRAGSPTYPLMLLNENRWRAQRYGVEGGLVDLSGGKIVPFRDVLEDVLELVREDAEFFDCVAEVEHARTIAARGTSADRQLALYLNLSEQGVRPEAALARVVDLLVDETASDAVMLQPGTRFTDRFSAGPIPSRQA